MPTSYTTQLRLALQATGENDGIWGTVLNNNVFTMIEEAIAGVLSLNVTSGNVTLSTTNGVSDQARHAVLKCIGSPVANRTVTVPTLGKIYIAHNDLSVDFDVTFTAGNDSVTLKQGEAAVIYCDGTDVFRGSGQGDLLSTNNLSDLTDDSVARTNLGLGNAAVEDVLDILGAGFPVGSIYFTAVNTNPSSLLGFGTWVQRAQGRVIIGVGEGTDANAVQKTYAYGNDSDGEYEHTLTVAEMPRHRHRPENNGTFQTSPGSGMDSNVHSPNITYSSYTAYEGGDEAHNNTQPSFGLYVWERTV